MASLRANACLSQSFKDERVPDIQASLAQMRTPLNTFYGCLVKLENWNQGLGESGLECQNSNF